MSLEKKYGLARLVAACACASEGRLYGYNEIKGILERGDDVDFMPSDDGPSEPARVYQPQIHKNIRGKEYYSDLSINNKKDNDNGNSKPATNESAKTIYKKLQGYKTITELLTGLIKDL